jgi:hypothetical protein
MTPKRAAWYYTRSSLSSWQSKSPCNDTSGYFSHITSSVGVQLRNIETSWSARLFVLSTEILNSIHEPAKDKRGLVGIVYLQVEYQIRPINCRDFDMTRESEKSLGQTDRQTDPNKYYSYCTLNYVVAST